MKLFSFKKVAALGAAFAASIVLPVRATSVVNLEIKHLQNTVRTYTVNLYPAKGVNIAFFKLGMKAKVVWLDDMRRIGLSFDGVLCEKWVNNSCTSDNSGANVIHLSLNKDVVALCQRQYEDPTSVEAEVSCNDLKEQSSSQSTSLSVMLVGQTGTELIVIDIQPMPYVDAPVSRTHTIFVVPNTTPIVKPIVPKKLEPPSEVESTATTNKEESIVEETNSSTHEKDEN